MDSPLPSPQSNIPGYPDSSSEESDSDSLGEIDDDNEVASCDKLYSVIGNLISQGCKPSEGCEQDDWKVSNPTVNNPGSTINTFGNESNSDDGFGEGDGDVDKSEATVRTASKSQPLSLILGELNNYRCESEENSQLSGSEDPGTAGSFASMTSDLDFPSSSELLFADRPFSAITLDTVLRKQAYLDSDNLQQVEDAGKDNDDTMNTGNIAPSDSVQ